MSKTGKGVKTRLTFRELHEANVEFASQLLARDAALAMAVWRLGGTLEFDAADCRKLEAPKIQEVPGRAGLIVITVKRKGA